MVAGWGKSKEVAFNECGADKKQHAGAWLRRVFDVLEGYDALTKMPVQYRVVDEDSEIRDIAEYVQEGDRDDPRTIFVKHTKSPATRIRFVFSYGRVGRTPKGLGAAEGSHLDLTKIAAGHDYRGILYLPPTGGKGVLALETIPNSAHPVESLNAWLARAAIDVAAEDVENAPDDAEVWDPTPYKLNFKQVVNYERLAKMIKNTSDVELVLRKTTISKHNKPGSEKLRLTNKIETQSERNKAVAVAQSLYGKVVGADDAGDEEAAMVELKSLAPGDVSGLEFNDGFIKVDDGSNGVKKIGIDQVDRYFNYPIGSTRQLPAKKWEQRVAAEVVSLQTLLGVDLDVS